MTEKEKEKKLEAERQACWRCKKDKKKVRQCRKNLFFFLRAGNLML
jgi:hypothetical protein